jgi:peroxiredoxin
VVEFPLPDNLPEPEDDGAADHLPGLAMPAVVLRATDGSSVDLSDLGPGRTVVFAYPLTGRPGVALPSGWDAIPGARGCTPESCGFRDRFEDLQDAGAMAVYGLSTQDTLYQQEVAERLALPYAMLSDGGLALADRLGLPTFTTSGMTLYRRLTLIVAGGTIAHVFYPVYPPDGAADEVRGCASTRSDLAHRSFGAKRSVILWRQSFCLPSFGRLNDLFLSRSRGPCAADRTARDARRDRRDPWRDHVGARHDDRQRRAQRPLL